MTKNGELLNDPDNPESEYDCLLMIGLDKAAENIIFDFAWNSEKSIENFAKLIFAIKNSDIIDRNIADMETDAPEDVKKILKTLESLYNKDEPVCKPLTVDTKDLR